MDQIENSNNNFKKKYMIDFFIKKVKMYKIKRKKLILLLN